MTVMQRDELVQATIRVAETLLTNLDMDEIGALCGREVAGAEIFNALSVTAARIVFNCEAAVDVEIIKREQAAAEQRQIANEAATREREAIEAQIFRAIGSSGATWEQIRIGRAGAEERRMLDAMRNLYFRGLIEAHAIPGVGKNFAIERTDSWLGWRWNLRAVTP